MEMALGIDFSWIFIDFGMQVGAKLALKINQKSIQKSIKKMMRKKKHLDASQPLCQETQSRRTTATQPPHIATQPDTARYAPPLLDPTFLWRATRCPRQYL